MRPDDPLAIAGATAVRTGDLATLERLLAEHPGVANAQVVARKGGYRAPLHVVCDWPGYFRNGPAMVKLLLAAGADPNGGAEGWGRQETPLHWAASSDDVDVAEALIDGGADVEAPGGSIGTPVENAVGYGCWRVARLLVQRGARVDKLWVAAGLGMLARIEELLRGASAEDINNAFWQSCHSGQRRAAELLRAHGADLNWVPDYAKNRKLDGDAADAPGTTVNQNFLAGRKLEVFRQTLQSADTYQGQRCCFGVTKHARFDRNAGSRHENVFRECSGAATKGFGCLSVNFVTNLEVLDIRANGFDNSGKVAPERER